MIQAHDFGRTKDGARVTRFRLTNAQGAHVDVLDLGGTVQSLYVPQRGGALFEAVTGFDDPAGYEGSASYMGATCGRVANRIAGARFFLNGREHILPANDGPNTLHGGGRAFSFGLWEAEIDGARLCLFRTSPDGESGFPGTLRAGVAYEFTDDNALCMTFTGACDAPTLYNPCNHCYFHLDDAPDVSQTLLWIGADAYLEVDGALIPTGNILPVADTPLDFTREKPIGRDIAATRAGYDHCWMLSGAGMRLVSRARSGQTGVALAVYTDRPALQFYSGNFLDEPRGRGGRSYGRRGAFCLETQTCPDAVHHPHFPSALLLPGEEFVSRSAYAFAVE